MMSEPISTPHKTIVGVTGNTFGTGDELARDILDAFRTNGLAVVNGWDLVEVNDILRRQNITPLVNLLADDLSVCHRSRYGQRCALPVDHDGIHRPAKSDWKADDE